MICPIQQGGHNDDVSVATGKDIVNNPLFALSECFSFGTALRLCMDFTIQSALQEFGYTLNILLYTT